MAEILIIDDDRMMNEALSSVVERMGHRVSNAFTLEKGIEEAFRRPFDVIFLDVRMPDGSGLSALPRLKEAPSRPEIVIITGYGDPDGAETAIKNGAWDYINKPASIQGMTLPLVRALQYREEKRARSAPVVLNRQGIVGDSPAMEAVLEKVAQAAAGDANVLVTGETGTGKELVARAIHANSDRASRSFVTVDCTALPESLVESLLFGHEKGAFTGASAARQGLVEQAHGGVLFLDEIGELPLSIQKTFLRVIEERRFRPIGAKKETESDFRLVAATNRDLDAMAARGNFREDLLFRLRAIVLEVPPLRERGDDLKALAIHYVNKLCESYGTETKGFAPEFFQALALYSWPGNVRELVHTLEQVLSVARHAPTIYPTHLPVHIRVKVAQASVDPLSAPPASSAAMELEDLDEENFPAFKDFRKTGEYRYLKRLVSLTGHSMKDACRLSGLSRTRLYELLREHGLLEK